MKMSSLTQLTGAFRLDPILYKKCQGDASRLCHTHGWNETSEMMPPGAIFSCLYRHAYRSVEQGRRVSSTILLEVQVLSQPAFLLCSGSLSDNYFATSCTFCLDLVLCFLLVWRSDPAFSCSSRETVRWRCRGSSIRGPWM